MTEKPTYEELEKRIQELERTESDRHRIENELRESEDRYKSLFNNNYSVMLLIDPENADIVDANLSAISYYGWSFEELTLKKITDINILPNEKIFQEMEIAKNEQRGHFFFRHCLSSGEIRDVEVYSGPISVCGKNLLYSIVHDVTEAQQLKDALQQNESLLNATQQLTKVGGWEWDIEQQSMFWTNEVYQIHDFKPDEFTHGSLEHIKAGIECYDIKDRPVVMAAFKRCAEKGHAYDLEFPFTTAMGRRIWIRTVANPVLEGNKVVKIIGNIMDITKHKQAEELLRESEERYKGLFINMNSGVAIYKVKGDAEDFIFTDFNKAAERIDKQKKEELIGRSVFEARPQVEEFGLIDVFREVWKTGKPKHYPITLYKDEKLDAWYENFIYKLPSGDIVAVFTNETDLKKVQEAFKKSEDIYRSMMESMKDAVYICSSDLRIEYMNPAMVERIGHDAIGEICHKSIYGMDEKCSWCVFDLLGQKDHIDYDLVDPKKNRYYSVANSPIFHSNGTFSKLTIFRDITQQKLNQEDLKKSAEQLRALALRHTHLEEAEKKKLALELHDRVGQNLTGLNINLNIIENMLPPDSPDKISDRLSDSLAITDKIFKHIRDVMADLRPETLDDYGLVAALGLYCKKFESRYNIRTQIKGSEFTPRLELEKEIALFRIVQEAMANAARHAMVEMITLTFESNDIINRMTIADNGVGFDYNKLKLLGNNNHWGLIIMQERAIAIGVNFSIESGKDKGTKVIVKIKK